MEREDAVAVRTQHPGRPGRRAVVVRDLASLRGPAQGTVVLPVRLYWSPPGRVFDLGKPHSLQAMYQFVLVALPGELASRQRRGSHGLLER
jgi:hypothetical protein